MAVKKALVLSANGEVQELQSGDTLDVPGGGGSDFYVDFHLFGRHSDLQETSSTLELVGTNILNNDKMPSSPTATLYAFGSVSNTSTEGDQILDAVQGATTINLGKITIVNDATDSWRSVDVTTNLGTLTSGSWELEFFQERTSGAGLVRVRKAMLVVKD